MEFAFASVENCNYNIIWRGKLRDVIRDTHLAPCEPYSLLHPLHFFHYTSLTTYPLFVFDFLFIRQRPGITLGATSATRQARSLWCTFEVFLIPRRAGAGERAAGNTRLIHFLGLRDRQQWSPVEALCLIKDPAHRYACTAVMRTFIKGWRYSDHNEKFRYILISTGLYPVGHGSLFVSTSTMEIRRRILFLGRGYIIRLFPFGCSL